MTYAEAIEFLYELQVFGAKFGLTNTVKLAGLAGHPERSLRFVHVAGTNGKGSTCAMLESIYRAAGLRTGLFTSPHLVHFGERIQVNRQSIPEADIIRLVTDCKEWAGRFSRENHPTFFEVVTVMALKYFVEQKCDIVIWETGMGGRLDATNIVTPLASVITNIQFDHQAWLGDTLEKIAREKAGIIKPGVPVITTVNDPAALKVIEETAEKNHSILHHVSTETPEAAFVKTLDLPLHGQHQKLNAALAYGTVQELINLIPVPDAVIRRGMETVLWAGRLQEVNHGDGRKILLDGAHNTGGAAALVAALKADYPGRAITLILGILSDKDSSEICGLLAPLAAGILLVPVKSKRSAAPEELMGFCQKANPRCMVKICNSLSQALTESERDALVLIAGSLYLIGEAMELLGLVPGNTPTELGLNEYGTGGKTN